MNSYKRELEVNKCIRVRNIPAGLTEEVARDVFQFLGVIDRMVMSTDLIIYYKEWWNTMTSISIRSTIADKSPAGHPIEIYITSSDGIQRAHTLYCCVFMETKTEKSMMETLLEEVARLREEVRDLREQLSKKSERDWCMVDEINISQKNESMRRNLKYGCLRHELVDEYQH